MRRNDAQQYQLDLFGISSEFDLISIAKSLGASSVGPLSQEEISILQGVPDCDQGIVDAFRNKILQGDDPLGNAFLAIRSQEDRRLKGATYTPHCLVDAIVGRLPRNEKPQRIVDPGCGSGRFLVRAGVIYEGADLVGFDIDPLASLMSRANLATHGLADRAQIYLTDYCTSSLKRINGPTFFIGNPPYVRHHQIDQELKDWLIREASSRGYRASGLAGLHVYFYLATLLSSSTGDRGAFITSSEWLDVNYGSLVRDLFAGSLGGNSITVIEPTAEPFPGVATTATITSFCVGSSPGHVKVARIDDIGNANCPQYKRVKKARFLTESRWSHLTRPKRSIPEGFIELGELCRVHRGSVTGANRIWIAGEHSEDLPESLLFPTVTKAKDLLGIDQVLESTEALRRVIDLPEDLSLLDSDVRKIVERFLVFARSQAADEGYVAKNRKSWWSVGLRDPAPILATYMARRPPKFVINKAEARHINIAHGLYPREELSADVLVGIASYLSNYVSTDSGRTYAGGLTKFEPREMERLLIPNPKEIARYNSC